MTRFATAFLAASLWGFSLCAQTADEQDSLALADLYQSTNGPEWFTPWDLGAPVSTWDGVTLNGSGRVTRLRLINANLSGPIPASIGTLTALTELRLDGNALSGELPDVWANMTSLSNLDLSDNTLVGQLPPSIYELSSVRFLYLYNNQLSGELSEDIGQLTSLSILRLEFNQLSGPIPVALGTITSLRQIFLHRNRLSGPIPASLGQLDEMFRLLLFANQLSGPIPPELGSLDALVFLNLSDNELSGSIPPELGSLTLLRDLDLSSNELEGGVPDALNGLSQLENFSIADNRLSGALPSWLLSAFPAATQIDVSGNAFSGPLPATADLPTLEGLSASDNNLSGPIPDLSGAPNLTSLTLSENNFSGPIPASIGTLTRLQTLALQENSLSGALPPQLAQLTRLNTLNLAKNFFSGDLEAIDGQALSLMEFLSLNENGFSGSIPNSFGQMEFLSELYLQDNALSGELPQSVADLEFLRILQVEGNSLSRLPALQSAANGTINTLYIEENKFTFADILPHLGVDDFIYQPQDSVGQPQTVRAPFGGVAELRLGFDQGVTGNRYDWYRNGALVETTFANRLTVTQVSEEDYGAYHCEVTNPAAPDLRLVSHAIVLGMGETTDEAAYQVRSASFTCDAQAVQVRLDAIDEAAGVVGYDIEITYPADRYVPNGTLDFSNSQLIGDPAHAELFQSFFPEPGRARFIVVISASSPPGTRFEGVGELLAVGFSVLPGAEIGDQDVISMSVEESYLFGFDDRPTQDGELLVAPQTNVRGRISYLGEPMPYDPSDPDRYNRTDVVGVSADCAPLTPALVPDLSGEFRFDILDAPNVRLTRDISDASAGDIALFINGADLAIVADMIFEQFAPSAENFPQFYKADVNGDQAVKPSDIFLLQRFIVRSLSDEEAAALAESWTFATASVLEEEEYQDYTAETVPLLPPCIVLEADLSVCQESVVEISAFLRGDVDGSFLPDQENTNLRLASSRHAVIDWRGAEQDAEDTTVWHAPVHFSDDRAGQTPARSFDLIGQGIDPRLEIVGATYPNRQVDENPSLANSDFVPFSNFSQDRGEFRLTAFVAPDARPLAPDSTLMRLAFRVPVGVPMEEMDFGDFLALVNGQQVETLELWPVPDLVTGLEQAQGHAFTLQPNPVQNRLQVSLPDIAGRRTLRVFDSQGRETLRHEASSDERAVVLDVRSLARGLHVLRLETERGALVRRFVVQ